MSLKSIANFDVVPIAEEVSEERWYFTSDPQLKSMNGMRYNVKPVLVTTNKNMAWKRVGYVHYIYFDSTVGFPKRAVPGSFVHAERVI